MENGLTVLSFGAGQDSMTILRKIMHDENFREKYVKGRLLVIMSDTGDEHPSTYSLVNKTMDLCSVHNIEFIFIKKEMGFHSEKCSDLRSFYKRTKTIGSKAFPKTCSDKLKIQPIYKFLEKWIEKNYSIPAGRKKAFYDFAEKNGKINVILGIAKGEESRASGNDSGPIWMQKTINKVYPLISEKMDRSDCQSYLKMFGPIPLPSNCMLCPYMSEVELIWLFNNHPNDFNDWVEMEQVKIQNNLHKGEKNFGVFGKLTLKQTLDKALIKYKHMTNDQINEYKMSHGHCVKSKF